MVLCYVLKLSSLYTKHFSFGDCVDVICTIHIWTFFSRKFVPFHVYMSGKPTPTRCTADCLTVTGRFDCGWYPLSLNEKDDRRCRWDPAAVTGSLTGILGLLRSGEYRLFNGFLSLWSVLILRSSYPPLYLFTLEYLSSSLPPPLDAIIRLSEVRL